LAVTIYFNIMNIRLYIYLLLFLPISAVFSQNKTKPATDPKNLIQFSGVIVDVDSLKPIPFANVFVKNTMHGTISDYFGYFSFVAQKGDTLVFSEIGYAKAKFIIPDTLTTNRYSLIQMLHKDTLWIAEAVVRAWPTREQFKQMFLSLHVQQDDMDRARKNLSYDNMRVLYNNMPMDGSMNYKYAMEQRYSQLYYAGQYPSYNILNPIAWAQFIEAWKRGDFKKKE